MVNSTVRFPRGERLTIWLSEAANAPSLQQKTRRRAIDGASDPRAASQERFGFHRKRRVCGEASSRRAKSEKNHRPSLCEGNAIQGVLPKRSCEAARVDKADGAAPVWLCLTASRKSRYVSTGIFMEPKHGNETKQRVRAAHPIASALNARLQNLLLQASRQTLESPSADAVRQGFFWGGDQKNVDDPNDTVWGENKEGS